MTASLDRANAALRIKFAAEIKAGLITSIGTQGQCRRKNNTATGPYSEHAWPGGNASDVMLLAGPTRKPLGDKVAAWMRSRPDLWSEVFWQVFAHFDHVHGTANPRMNFDNQQIPPCAGGVTPPTGEDDMDFMIRVYKGQNMAFYEAMQAKTGGPEKGTPGGNARYWGSDYVPPAGQGKPSQTEWEAAIDDFVGASAQIGVFAAPSTGVTTAVARNIAKEEIAKSRNVPS